jgi:hypothetical protein
MSTSGLLAPKESMDVKSLGGLLALSASQLRHTDTAEMNLLCATGLPGAENLSVGRCLATLDAWARRVRRETDRHLYRFRQAPAEFNHSEGYFRMLMLVTVLQQDFGVRYNPDRIRGIDFRDSRDLFIHGLLDEPHTGTCASMPVLYVAAGRRLGYPLKLVLTHGHIFARWEGADGRDRFNVECASRGMLSFPDAYYKTWPTPLTDEQVRKGRYLMSLGETEELAVFVESRGHCLLDNGRIREARMAYEHACRLDPLSPGHWSWLEDARVREAPRPPGGDNWKTFSNWGCSMTISCLPIANSTLSAEPVRTFPLDSTRYRNYHPTLGRWIQRDPAGYVDGANLHQYAGAAPLSHGDPSGLYGLQQHFGDTENQALEAGFCEQAAFDIADADQDWDEHGRDAFTQGVFSFLGVGLLFGSGETYQTHFPGAGPPVLWAPQNPVVPGLGNAHVQNLLDQATDSCELEDIGRALHALQDSYAHAGQPTLGGHPSGRPLIDPENGRVVYSGVGDQRLDDPAWDRGSYAACQDDIAEALADIYDACSCILCPEG